MSEHTYHHKDLKNTLLQEGIRIINEHGINDFSMRKLAIACHVSHMAPYKHFQDKEEFLNEVTEFIENEFYLALQNTAMNYRQNPKQCIIELGKAYVQFMVEHVDCMKYYFLGTKQHNVELNDIQTISSESALGVFRDCAISYLKTTSIPKEKYYDEIIFYWALPMGLSTLYAYHIVKEDCTYLKQVEAIMEREADFRSNFSN